jgi:transglutaminase-like putative cysteine protease
MSFRKNRRLTETTSIVVLALFTWMVCGGNVWAESRAAQRDPRQTLLRLIDDPRLALSAEEKAYVRQAAERLRAEKQAPVSQVPAAQGPADPVTEMQTIAARLSRLLPDEGVASKSAGTPAIDSRAVQGLTESLEVVHERVLADFAATADRVRDAKLPKVIQARQAAARAGYLKNIQAVFQDLRAARQSPSPDKAKAALAAAVKRLSRSNDERPQQKLDPSRLPFRGAKAVDKKPADPPKAGPKGLALAKAAAPPAADDLAANEDAQITPDIRALAASLGNHPLRIYDWVRNNIEYVPTYGSVQGAGMTLVAKRGNAFDTASLLIALLRAANVPARYVTGTVQVPADQTMNWVGGAQTANVAQQILGQGGVPNVGLLSGGAVTALRIDHVWVEAFIDYIPSRGAVNGPGDTWVPMDPSFKLHTFAPRSDLFTANPIGDTFSQPGDHFFDVDESLGKISNVNDQAFKDRLVDWASRSDQYVLDHGGTAAPASLVGGPAVVQKTSTLFTGSLPYPVVTRAAGVSTLPAGLRHYVTLNGYASDFDRALGSPAFSVKVSLPSLNSGRLGIQFEPATQADADTLAAARTGGATSLPVYLINVVPVVKVDGVEKGRGSAVRMGSFYSVDAILQSPASSDTVPFQVVAGDEIVAGVTGNGVTREVIEKRYAENPVNTSAEYLHEVGLHYWMECDYLNGITAQSLGVHRLRLPSIGFFSSPLTVSYIFGAPRSAVYQSRTMDVRQSLLGVAGPDAAKNLAFLKQSGIQGSYLEGSVFDQLERRSTPTVRGVSSIHLISTAASQGIPIYHVTSANAGAVLPLLQVSSAVKSDINTAVSQGKTVLVPERNLDLGTWRGVGYIVQDETTGAAAYLISGGAAGGGLTDCLKELLPKLVEILLIALLFILLAILIAMLLAALAEILAGVLVGAGAAAAFAGFLGLLEGLSPLALAF